MAPADALMQEIDRSRLDAESKGRIVSVLEESHQNFLSGKHTACLGCARVALEILGKGISGQEKWGDALCRMARDGVITGNKKGGKSSDEACLSTLYTWVSDIASHDHLSDEEKALFGRRIILSMCLFLAAKHNKKGNG